MKPRVVVNGIGAIGKRVAHAIKLQDDMELVGISDVAPTFVLRTNLEPDGPLYKTRLYASTPEGKKKMEEAGMLVEGTLEELLASGEVDVVIDATPAGIGEKNKPLYEKYGVRAIFEGGEKAHVAEMTFNSLVNYEWAKDKHYVRVPSCNTTSLARTLHALDSRFGVAKAFVALVRRAVDPWNPKKGPVNAIVPDPNVPSHHGPDLQTVMPHIDIMTMAVKVPTTLAHTHIVHVTLKQEVSEEDVIKAFDETPRVILLRMSDGYSSTAEIIERFRDLGRRRYDMYEVAVWEDSVKVINKNEVVWMHAVHSEAIVIPENVDAVRAMFGMMEKWKSIKKTNKSLGIKG